MFPRETRSPLGEVFDDLRRDASWALTIEVEIDPLGRRRDHDFVVRDAPHDCLAHAASASPAVNPGLDPEMLITQGGH